MYVCTVYLFVCGVVVALVLVYLLLVYSYIHSISLYVLCALRCALCFIPQSWMLAVLDGFGMAQGLGPTPEALRRIQQQ